MAQLGRFISMMTWHGAHPRPQKYGRKGIMTTGVLRLKGISCTPVHRTPLPALPSLGITQFFLVIRKGDWEGLFLWKIMIFVRRYLPVVAKGLLLRKELWSHISLGICNIWASSQPWLCCRHTYASSFPALGASSRNSRVGMSFLSLSLWRAEGHELPDDPHPCPTSHSLWEEAWVLLCLSSVNIN